MDAIFAITIFVFGLAFGSFLNVCIYRLPRGLPISLPKSKCPSCGNAIRPYDNIPVLSWLILRGRCRRCRARISPRYMVVELLSGLLFVACYAEFGLTPLALKFTVFSYLLLGLIFTDAETQLLPDKLTLPGFALGLVFSLIVPINDLVQQYIGLRVTLPFSFEVAWRLTSLADALLGAAVGASFIFAAGTLYMRARGIEGMGFGDVKLMAMIGAFLGTRLTIFTLLAASLFGSLVGLGAILIVWMRRTRRRMERANEPASVARQKAWRSAQTMYRRYPIPFGVFLGAMAIFAAFFGNSTVSWYVETFW